MNSAAGLSRVAQLLQSALDGDASIIDELHSVAQADIVSAAGQLAGKLSFGRPAVLRVLMDWRAGQVTEEQVRLWALLMFTGGFPDTHSRKPGSVQATAKRIHVDYSDDEVVNDIVFELKDLGEVIDGIITPAQRNEMIKRLASAP